MEQQQERPKAVAPRVADGIAIRDKGLMPENFGQMVEFCKMVAHSTMCPKALHGDVGGVIIAVQMGAELGFSPMQAIQNIAVINGRPALWGDALWALVKSAPDLMDASEWFEGEGDGLVAHCRIQRSTSKEPVHVTFGISDAKAAGLWGKTGPWKQYPRRMLQMRARGFAARDAYPDRLRGLSIREEVQDVPTPKVVEHKPSFESLSEGRGSFSAKVKEATPKSNEACEADEAQRELAL